jgi:hypothetical protein
MASNFSGEICAAGSRDPNIGVEVGYSPAKCVQYKVELVVLSDYRNADVVGNFVGFEQIRSVTNKEDMRMAQHFPIPSMLNIHQKPLFSV